MPPFTLDELFKLPPKDLRQLYCATFGIKPRSRSKAWMIKRICAAPVFADSVEPAAQPTSNHGAA